MKSSLSTAWSQAAQQFWQDGLSEAVLSSIYLAPVWAEPPSGDMLAGRRCLVLSDASVYGEGAAYCGDCGPCLTPSRHTDNLVRKRWELYCPICDEMMMPLPSTPATPLAPLNPAAQALAQAEAQWQQAQPNLQPWVLRVPQVFGPIWSGLPEAQSTDISQMLAQWQAGQPPVLPEDWQGLRTALYERDVLELVAFVASLPETARPSSGWTASHPERLAMFEIAMALYPGPPQPDPPPFVLSQTGDTQKPRHQLLENTIPGWQAQQSFRGGLLELARTAHPASARPMLE